MGEGVSDPNYLYAGALAQYQGLCVKEHVSDIGVYYDPYISPVEQLAQASAQHTIDNVPLDVRLKMFYAARGF